MEAREKTMMDAIREEWLAEYNRQLDILDHLLLRMEEMRSLCIYRINGVCWRSCAARDFCQPEAAGLVTVEDLREGCNG